MMCSEGPRGQQFLRSLVALPSLSKGCWGAEPQNWAPGGLTSRGFGGEEKRAAGWGPGFLRGGSFARERFASCKEERNNFC